MGFFIVILILILLPLIWPYISRAIRRYAEGKIEDRMRRMMGMPTRAEEKRAQKTRYAQSTGRSRDDRSGSHRYGFRKNGRNHNVGNPGEDLRMMRQYAEDVEFVEIREYSAELHFEQDLKTGTTRMVLEEQVSDAEFVVIK